MPAADHTPGPALAPLVPVEALPMRDPKDLLAIIRYAQHHGPAESLDAAAELADMIRLTTDPALARHRLWLLAGGLRAGAQRLRRRSEQRQDDQPKDPKDQVA